MQSAESFHRPNDMDAITSLRAHLEEISRAGDSPGFKLLVERIPQKGVLTFQLKEIARLLSSAPLESLYGGRLENLSSRIFAALEVVKKIEGFDPTNTTRPTNEELATLGGELKAALDPLEGESAAWMAHLALAQSIKLNAVNVAASAVLSHLEAARRIAGQIEDTKRAVDLTAQKIADTGVKEKVRDYAEIFGAEADEQKNSSKLWLLAAFCGVVAAILWIFYAVDQNGKPLDVPVPALVQNALQRLVVLSLLYYAIIFSVRNFSAARHNMVVNRHRKNALEAFEAFVNGASADQQTKNAVLLQATKAIFDAQPSGFLKNDNDAPQPSSQVIEIFRAAASKT